MCDVTCITAGGNRQPRWQQTTTATITALVILLKLLVICTVSALVWLAPGAVLCGRKEVLLLNKYSYRQEKTRPKQQLCRLANPELNTFNAIKLEKWMTCVNELTLTPLVLILLKPDIKSIDQSKARSLNIAYTRLQHEVKRNRKETFEW